MMTYKQIEGARELRLWITQIFAPAAIVAGALLSVPEIREPIANKVSEVKGKIKTKLKK